MVARREVIRCLETDKARHFAGGKYLKEPQLYLWHVAGMLLPDASPLALVFFKRNMEPSFYYLACEIPFTEYLETKMDLQAICKHPQIVMCGVA